MDQKGPRKKLRLSPPDASPYILKKVLDDIPLQNEDGLENIEITCVEHWNGSLYIGTSSSEIIHLVGLPAEDESEPPTYILASRLQPSGHDSVHPSLATGVQQIVVLPGASKACVLCNGTVSFYSLPELSPASNKDTQGVQWIGGMDENEETNSPDGSIVMIATTKRIMQVRVGEKLRGVKPNIEYPGCLKSSRRGTIACVADDKNYALLEVEHQAKIPLFPISSISVKEELPVKNFSPSRTETGGHSRSTSLFTMPSPSLGRDSSPSKSSLRPPNPEHRAMSPGHGDEANSRPTSRPRSSTEGTSHDASSRRPSQIGGSLKPHILSPFPDEFMLTTGTTQAEPGVAMFVNLDGDLVPKGTLEFEQYPDSLIFDDFSQHEGSQVASHTDRIIVALFEKTTRGEKKRGLEIQQLSEDGENRARKVWTELPTMSNPTSRAGLHSCLSTLEHFFAEIGDLLQQVRYKPYRRLQPSGNGNSVPETAVPDEATDDQQNASKDYETSRNVEEKRLVQRLCHVKTKAVVWSGNSLWQILQTPLLLQLESDLMQSIVIREDKYDFGRLNISKVLSLLGRIRDQEPRDEAEFRTLTYIRQKASVVLLLNLLTTLKTTKNLDASCKLVESALHESLLDPRILLLLSSPLSDEVLQGSQGIWLHQGLVDCLNDFDHPIGDVNGAPLEYWMMVRHYLMTWQEKRGYGSISDEKFVFDSVDAALLLLLLHMDASQSIDDRVPKSIPSKNDTLNVTIDNWKGDFDRAALLLERYHRLYILSRLHQSRKSPRDVLATWKRISEGEFDAGQDVSIYGVQWQVRNYLPKRTDVNLVREYALWLATQNAELAVQVFADDNSRVKFKPAEVVSMLKDHAPDAVQMYLEHLVFAKHLDQYADDLVGYYLDSVLNVLEESESARQSLADSYSTYRAMTSPKPTYLNFITQNTPDEDWWQSRLRLLQLLGSGGYATTGETGQELTYSIDKVLDRLKPFSQYLVSESIILDARQGRHEEALKLLVHGLGDYDTAVRYCYFGGPAPSSGTIDASQLPSRDAQTTMFHFLYTQFLAIDDMEERLERTSHLLGTFASWFDPLKILESIPGDWSLTLLSEFLLRSFRAATNERNEAVIRRALSAAQCLQKQTEFIQICEKIGAKIESENGGQNQSSKGDIEMMVT